MTPDQSLSGTGIRSAKPYLWPSLRIIESESSDCSRVVVLRQATANDFVFRNVDGISPADQLCLLLFSYSIWRSRADIVRAPFTPTTPSLAADAISSLFMKHQKSFSKKEKSRKASDLRKKTEFLLLYSALPPHSIRVFTDGSSYGNPGPAGAGFAACTGNDPFPPNVVSHSESLGTATNNAAELKAILNACDHFLASSFFTNPDPLPLLIFSDSEYAINALNGKFKTKVNRALVRRTSQSLDTLRNMSETRLIHVPVHVDIPVNEFFVFFFQ